MVKPNLVESAVGLAHVDERLRLRGAQDLDELGDGGQALARALGAALDAEADHLVRVGVRVRVRVRVGVRVRVRVSVRVRVRVGVSVSVSVRVRSGRRTGGEI